MKNLRSMLMCLAVISMSGRAESAEQTPAEVASAYARSLEGFRQIKFTANVKCYHTSAKLNRTNLLVQEDRIQVVRDGDRWRLSVESLMKTPDRKGAFVDSRFRKEEIYRGRGRLFIGDDPGANDVRLMAHLDELPESVRREAGAERALLFLTGYLMWNGNHRLPEILEQSTLSLRTDNSALSLEASGKWGRHVLLLDPARNYLPRRVSQRKEMADWTDVDRPLSDMTTYEYRGAKLKAIEQTAIVGASAPIEGRQVVTAFTLEERLLMEDGNSALRRFAIVLSDIDFQPDFVSNNYFAPSKPIPDGTEVVALDAPNIRYEWQGGEIIKSINQATVESLDRLRFERGRWMNRTYVALSVLAVSAVVLVLVRVVGRRERAS